MKLEFTETQQDQSYVATICDLVVFNIYREGGVWVAYDCEGMAAGREQFRNDLFELLQIDCENA